ncbi:MAG: helix-turn-helix domain-containing protein [Candidatus Limnocylindrales bacterium]
MPLKSDPRRLPRRNHYQEGPDFLFLATQGGRPPTSVRSSSVAPTVRRRMGALRRWADGEAADTVSASVGCGRATLFRWRDRYARDGIAGLVDRPRLGDHTDLAPDLERAIILVRLLSYWNSHRIAAEFGRRGIVVSHAAIDRLLARYGTSRPSVARVPGPRYERSSPNELWHIDL